MLSISTSKCPKCESSGFEIHLEEVEGAKFKYNIVRCRNCKTAIGVVEYYNIGATIYKLAEKLGVKL